MAWAYKVEFVMSTFHHSVFLSCVAFSFVYIKAKLTFKETVQDIFIKLHMLIHTEESYSTASTFFELDLSLN